MATSITDSEVIIQGGSSFEDITTGQLDGSGLFDLLMASAKQHLLEEFAAQRLKGPDYTKVYLGSMEAALGNTIQYLLGIALVDSQRLKLALEAEELRQKILLIPLEQQKLEAEIELVEAQVTKINAEIELIPLEEQKLQSEITRIDADVLRIYADTTRIEEQTKQVTAETSMIQYKLDYVMPAELQLMQAQITKTEHESELVGHQSDAAEFNVDSMLPQELLKLVGEVSFMEAKAATEAKQPQLVDSNIALIQAKTTSEAKQPALIDKNIALLEQQTQGFLRDAEQKASKIMADAWSVQKSVDDGIYPPAGLDNSSITRVLNTLIIGVGA